MPLASGYEFAFSYPRQGNTEGVLTPYVGPRLSSGLADLQNGIGPFYVKAKAKYVMGARTECYGLELMVLLQEKVCSSYCISNSTCYAEERSIPNANCENGLGKVCTRMCYPSHIKQVAVSYIFDGFDLETSSLGMDYGNIYSPHVQIHKNFPSSFSIYKGLRTVGEPPCDFYTSKNNVVVKSSWNSIIMINNVAGFPKEIHYTVDSPDLLEILIPKYPVLVEHGSPAEFEFFEVFDLGKREYVQVVVVFSKEYFYCHELHNKKQLTNAMLHADDIKKKCLNLEKMDIAATRLEHGGISTRIEPVLFKNLRIVEVGNIVKISKFSYREVESFLNSEREDLTIQTVPVLAERVRPRVTRDSWAEDLEEGLEFYIKDGVMKQNKIMQEVGSNVFVVKHELPDSGILSYLQSMNPLNSIKDIYLDVKQAFGWLYDQIISGATWFIKWWENRLSRILPLFIVIAMGIVNPTLMYNPVYFLLLVICLGAIYSGFVYGIEIRDFEPTGGDIMVVKIRQLVQMHESLKGIDYYSGDFVRHFEDLIVIYVPLVFYGVGDFQSWFIFSIIVIAVTIPCMAGRRVSIRNLLCCFLMIVVDTIRAENIMDVYEADTGATYREQILSALIFEEVHGESVAQNLLRFEQLSENLKIGKIICCLILNILVSYVDIESLEAAFEMQKMNLKYQLGFLPAGMRYPGRKYRSIWIKSRWWFEKHSSKRGLQRRRLARALEREHHALINLRQYKAFDLPYSKEVVQRKTGNLVTIHEHPRLRKCFKRFVGDEFGAVTETEMALVLRDGIPEIVDGNEWNRHLLHSFRNRSP